MGFGLRAPKNRVPGLDVAGTVVAVGADVTRFEVGDEVFGISQRLLRRVRVRAGEDKLARKPANLTFEQAAVVADLRRSPPSRPSATSAASRRGSAC